MDHLLSKVTQHAMNHAIRCGITITSGYAIRQCSRLLRTVKENEVERDEIASLQQRLEAKIRIISPAIDMIELIAARGNTSLESAVTLTKQIRWDIQSLGVRIAKAAADEEAQRRGSSKARTEAQNQRELRLIIADMKRLLHRIEDAVPLINLAITTSGVNLSTTLPSTVSPSRLLQASTFLTSGDTRYAMAPRGPVQVGPVFTLSMYMLFSAHSYRPHEEGEARETTWKEVIHKARVKLLRVPLNRIYDLPDDGQVQLAPPSLQPRDKDDSEDLPSEGKAYEFAYQLLIIEDLEDDRVHTFEEDELQPGPLDDVALAGMREALPIHEISKIFYADTGKILNIGTDGEINSPVLLLKRDINAVPPRRMMSEQTAERPWYQDEDDDQVHQETAPASGPTSRKTHETSTAGADGVDLELPSARPWSLPPDLDPEWMAFEVYNEDQSSEDEDDPNPDTISSPSPDPGHTSRSKRGSSLDPSVTAAFSSLHVNSITPSSSPRPSSSTQLIEKEPLSAPANIHSLPTAPTALPALRTSLSLLELLIRLTALQQFQQTSHLAINDELLNFFLSEAGTTGAGGDAETRQRVRREARERVGFDPYDESPIKRRGEDYLEHYADGSRYEATEAEDTGQGDSPISTQYSPRLADGYRASPRSPPILFPLRAVASATSKARSRRTGLATGSPSMSSPLARKSSVPSGQSPVVGKGHIARGSQLVKSGSDSTLGTSPASASVQQS